MKNVNEFLLGACYYPEHWEENDYIEDVKSIKAMGFNVVRMGEFSWSMFEKNEGEYDFSYLAKVVSACRDEGLSVILGTPTAAPPIWLPEKYPEILCADDTGCKIPHGSRQHHNHTREVYLDYVKKIVRKMGEAFLEFSDTVIGRQINIFRNLL